MKIGRDMALHPRATVLLVVLALAATALSGCTVPWSPEGTNQRSGPGDGALDFIRGSPYTKLRIVIDHVPGAGPNEAALEVLKATAAEVLDKREVLITKHGDIPAKGKDHAYSFQEVNEIEKTHREEYSDGDTAVLYVLYLDGHSSQDTDKGSILGAAYHASSVVMFKETLRKAAEQNKGDIPGIYGSTREDMEDIIERAVLVHEFGHILGLVDNGIPMQTDHLDRDPDHTPKHSSNKNSVMYYAVENSGALAGLIQLQGNVNLPYKFDTHDKADIEAAKKSG